ncbi:hypothetical protein NDU88_006350 [Pleurodeles waltl]|uniref:ABC-2 type transporter transmembrane domain-containing protein n=1 Tax=Pleurodeles waltl TaxID=8319 RepID=A0AAV7X015_PLEWA|nr:hypothetical protein NDU88_006350 [Pleurodeles waltl]
MGSWMNNNENSQKSHIAQMCMAINMARGFSVAKRNHKRKKVLANYEHNIIKEGARGTDCFQPKIECFFIMLITLMMISYTAASLALAIAVGHSVTTLSNLVTSIIFIFMSIFSGVLINLKTIQVWLAWLKYLSIHRYGLNVCMTRYILV